LRFLFLPLLFLATFLPALIPLRQQNAAGGYRENQYRRTG
jgi:hypothetical protein